MVSLGGFVVHYCPSYLVEMHRSFIVCYSEDFTADKLFEYQWPQTGNKKGGEQYMIQEQVSQYLGVLSFKRKYPGEIQR